MDPHSTIAEFSLVKGGLLFETERRLRRGPRKRYDPVLRALAFSAIGWLPLLLFTLPSGGPTVGSLFKELQVHAQLLVALPALLAAEPYIDGRLAFAVRQFLNSNLVATDGLQTFEADARRAMRWRDSYIAEALLLILAYALTFITPADPTRTWTLSGDGFSMAGWWNLAVSQPLFRFLALRWIWRGVVWSAFLLRVSRLPLTLVPTHPDMMGGLGFLPICQASFSPVVFSLAVVVAAYTSRVEPKDLSANPTAYVIPLVVIAAGAVVLVFAPMSFFVPQLVRAKRIGDEDFSKVASKHSRQFEHKWFRGGPESELLGAPEMSSLADIGTAFTLSRRMRLLLWDKMALLAVVGAALAPLLMLLVMDRQFISVLKFIHDGLR
ncbi:MULTISPECIES: hypothetical protein [Myxococcus]|uniref:hypothetical protein n=1 Tax=Myxococcus TaxID=32 RepID=UPI001126F59A|nr:MULTISPECIES: hypothetical protein [Myxococcus]QDE97554.1 hypothetical protein BHS05_17855 [Myxococcus xanthus]WAM30102.1 hypothetical protein OZ403_19015 [Myxococcus sp. NMCA1]